MSVWAPLSTIGKATDTSAGLPALSVTVTVAVPPAPAAVGVPLITPVPVSMVNPAGSPVAAYDFRSVSVVVGDTDAATSTSNEDGAV